MSLTYFHLTSEPSADPIAVLKAVSIRNGITGREQVRSSQGLAVWHQFGGRAGGVKVLLDHSHTTMFFNVRLVLLLDATSLVYHVEFTYT